MNALRSTSPRCRLVTRLTARARGTARVLRILLRTAVALVALFPAGAHAQWVVDGVPLCTANRIQQAPLTVSDGAGGALVLWTDLRGADDDLYVHHVFANGTKDPALPAQGQPVAVVAGHHEFVRMVSDGAGGAFVTWQDTRDFAASEYDVYAHHILPNGTLDPAWPANGCPVITVPPSGVAKSQFRPVIVPDGAGGAIVAWFDNRSGGATLYDIYATRVRPDGTVDPAWPAGGVALSTASGHQMNPTIASDGAGGAFVAWESTGQGIYATRVLSTGVVDPAWPANGRHLTTTIFAQGARPRIVASTEPPVPVVVFDTFAPDGTFHGTFNMGTTTVDRTLPISNVSRAAARFTVNGGSCTLGSIKLPISVSSSGAPPSTNILRVRLTTDAGGAPGTTLEVLSENAAWPPWADPFTTATTLVSSSQPTLLGGSSYWIVTEPTTFFPEGPDNFTVVYRWSHNSSATPVAIRQQSAQGALPSDPWPGSAGSSNLALRVNANALASAGAIVTWEDHRLGAANTGIYAQRIRSSGTLDPAWPAEALPVCDTTGQQLNPELVPDGAGGAILTWQDARYGTADIFTHHVRLTGTVDPAWPAGGRALCLAAGNQQFPQLVSDAVGGAIVAWQDARGANEDIYAQRVQAGGTLDPSWPGDGRRVCGHVAQQLIPTLATDGDHGAIVAWQDARGGVTTSHDIYVSRVLFNSAVADVPLSGAEPGFRLLPAFPNPARSAELAIPFELPAAGHVSVTVLDPAGRRVRTIADRVFTAGRQRVVWDGRDDAGSALANGIYFIRVRAAHTSATERVALLR